jgi:hypothetical protein
MYHYCGKLLGTSIPWGETRSSWVEFNYFVLSIISKAPDFIQDAERVIDTWAQDRQVWKCDPMEVIKTCPTSWAICSPDEVSRLQSLVMPVAWFARDQFELFLQDFGMRFRYSAASLAIRFLQSYPDVAFSQTRKIILFEDHMSIANSPSHAHGLIRFCRQNPRLRIERVVNLWRAGISPNDSIEYPLRTSIITKSFGRWIFEALELQKHGMPQGSFKLLLDGNPILEKASQIFEAVKGDAARQAALDACYERNILPCPSWIERRRRRGYQWEDLPQAITSLQNGEYASFIECNFDVGAPYDIESLINERLNWTAEEWEDEWELREDDEFNTEAPLPSWEELHPICTYHSRFER